jgi:hypothetical protein
MLSSGISRNIFIWVLVLIESPSDACPTLAGRILPIQSLLDCQAAQARLVMSKYPKPQVDLIGFAADTACAPCTTCLSVTGESRVALFLRLGIMPNTSQAAALQDTAVVRFRRVM